MKTYVVEIITVSTDVYAVESEIFLLKTREEAVETLRNYIRTAQLDIIVSDTDTYIDHYIEGVGSFYASIIESQVENEESNTDKAQELLESILERYDSSMSTTTASFLLDRIIKEIEDFLDEK